MAIMPDSEDNFEQELYLLQAEEARRQEYAEKIDGLTLHIYDRLRTKGVDIDALTMQLNERSAEDEDELFHEIYTLASYAIDLNFPRLDLVAIGNDETPEQHLERFYNLKIHAALDLIRTFGDEPTKVLRQVYDELIPTNVSVENFTRQDLVDYELAHVLDIVEGAILASQRAIDNNQRREIEPLVAQFIRAEVGDHANVTLIAEQLTTVLQIIYKHGTQQTTSEATAAAVSRTYRQEIATKLGTDMAFVARLIEKVIELLKNQN